MKKLLFLTTVLFNMAASAEATPNKTISMPESIMKNVIERDLQKLQTSTQELKKLIESTTTDAKRSEPIDQSFTRLLSAWKAVETIYIIGELDDDLLDTPRLIDAYHNGKENTLTQLQRILKNKEPAKTALFKNTFKSINALSYYLYNDKKITIKEREYALYTLATLSKHFHNISEGYQHNKEIFYSKPEESMAYLLNALIDSSYKLKEWRIGDPAGLSKKYQGAPDNRHQEYPYSQQSLNAIESILNIHADMMAKQPYPNLGSEAIEQGAHEAVDKIRKLIRDAEKLITTLKTKPLDFTNISAIKPLYETLQDLNDAYYGSLVAALPVQAKILDADGD